MPQIKDLPWAQPAQPIAGVGLQGNAPVRFPYIHAPTGYTIIITDTNEPVIAGPQRRARFRSPADQLIDILTASVDVASSAGDVLVDLQVDGVSILGEGSYIRVPEGQRTSVGFDPQPVIATPLIAFDSEVIPVIAGAGTGATGLQVNVRNQ